MVNKSFSAEEARAIEDLFMKNMNRPPRPPANRDPPELLEMNEKPLPDLLEIQHDKPLPGLRDLAFSNKKEILSTKRKISGRIARNYCPQVMSHLKHSGIIDLLENKELVIPYNKNMIRKFRSPEKSLKEQIQREKNNLSSRTSRMKTQLLNNALHEEANHVSIENERLKINLARNRVYANLLCKGLDSEKLDLSEEWEKQKKTMHTKPKNFTMMKNKQEMELKMSTPELIPMDSSTAGEILSFKRKITNRITERLTPSVLYHLQQTGIIRYLENAEVVVPYQKNMARNLGALDKSSEARAQRDRNNLVSRVSRMKQKMLDQALEFEEQKINYENRQLKMRIAQNRVFVNELLELTGRDKVDLAAEWQIAQEETDYEMTDSESETDSTT